MLRTHHTPPRAFHCHPCGPWIVIRSVGNRRLLYAVIAVISWIIPVRHAAAIFFQNDGVVGQWCMPNTEYLVVLEHSCIKHLQKGEFQRARQVKFVHDWQAANRERICGDEEFRAKGQLALDEALIAQTKMGENWRCNPPPSIWSEALQRFRQSQRSVSIKMPGDELVSDSNIRTEVMRAWQESMDGQKMVHEQGGWIVKDEQGRLSVQRWPIGSPGSIAPTPQPSNAMGHFHTHPYAADETLIHLPSPRDIDFTERHHIPGFIVDRQSILRIDPQSPEQYYHDIFSGR